MHAKYGYVNRNTGNGAFSLTDTVYGGYLHIPAQATPVF